MAQVIVAIQMVLEEKFIYKHDVHPLRAVGTEGRWQRGEGAGWGGPIPGARWRRGKQLWCPVGRSGLLTPSREPAAELPCRSHWETQRAASCIAASEAGTRLWGLKRLWGAPKVSLSTENMGSGVCAQTARANWQLAGGEQGSLCWAPTTPVTVNGAGGAWKSCL